MKRSTKSIAKIIRKHKRQLRRDYKKLARKIVKRRKRSVRLIRRQPVLLRKRAKRLSKRLRKLRLKIIRSHRQARSKTSRVRPVPAKKSKKSQAAHQAPARLAMVPIVVAALIGLFCGQQLSQNHASLFGLNPHSHQTALAPSKITSYGPSQADSHFSTYPTWSQDFAKGNGRPDSRYWNIFQGKVDNDNNEAQYYTSRPANVHIGEGALSLTATHERQPKGYQYASARVDTENKLAFLYGRIDITAQLPSGVGTWPAMWFLPANTKYEQQSPSSDSLRYMNGGELDMSEAVGFNPHVIYGVVHTKSDLKKSDPIGAFNQVTIPNNYADYNLYSMLWTPTTITYEVNNTPFFTYTRVAGADYTTWPFDQPFYLILNLAMGGKWGGQDTADFPGNGIDNSALPASLKIKSIYYYPYIGPR